MSGVISAWVVGALAIAWTQGLNPQRQGGTQWPPPFAFLDLTIFLAICSLIARANSTVGGLLAWGVIIALLIRGEYQSGGQPASIMQDLNNAVQALTGPQSAASQHAAGTGP